MIDSQLLYPTKSNIFKKITEFCSDPDVDVLFLTSASHGTQDADINNTEKDGKSEVICALDDSKNLSANGYIHDYELLNVIDTATKNRTTPMIIYCLIDSCHSGTILNLDNNIDAIPAATHIYNIHMRIDNNKIQHNPNVHICCFSGCQDDQLSSESTLVIRNRPLVRGHSTKALEQALTDLINVQSPNTQEISCFTIYIKMLEYIYLYRQQASLRSCDLPHPGVKFSIKQTNSKFLSKRDAVINVSEASQLPNMSTNNPITYDDVTKQIKTLKFIGAYDVVSTENLLKGDQSKLWVNYEISQGSNFVTDSEINNKPSVQSSSCFENIKIRFKCPCDWTSVNVN